MQRAASKPERGRARSTRRRSAVVAVDPRPPLAPALERLLAGLVQTVPSLDHVDPRRLLLVAGQARGQARASIRSLAGATPPISVIIDRRQRHFELTLRPPWFRASTMERRLEALLHELWHIDARKPKQLDSERRHQRGRRPGQRVAIGELVEHALQALEPELFAPLGHDGEVLVPAWLVRPVLTGEPQRQRRFTNKDMYLQPVHLHSPQTSRSVWW